MGLIRKLVHKIQNNHNCLMKNNPIFFVFIDQTLTGFSLLALGHYILFLNKRVFLYLKGPKHFCSVLKDQESEFK